MKNIMINLCILPLLLTTSVYADKFSVEVFKKNEGQHVGKLEKSGKPCSMAISSNKNKDEVVINFKYDSKEEIVTYRAYSSDKGQYDGIFKRAKSLFVYYDYLSASLYESSSLADEATDNNGYYIFDEKHYVDVYFASSDLLITHFIYKRRAFVDGLDDNGQLDQNDSSICKF